MNQQVLTVQPPEEVRRAVVLTVDDHPDNLDLLNGILLPLNCVILEATNGRQALELAGQQPRPDLILLDIMMPEMNGHQVLAALRSAPHTADIPVIFVTALNDSRQEEQSLHEGAVDFISKPYNPDILLSRVKLQLDLKQARDLLAEQNQRLAEEMVHRQEASANQEKVHATYRALTAAIIDNINDGIFITDTTGNILQINPAFTAITGFSATDVLGQNPRLMRSGVHPPAFYQEMWTSVLQDGQWHGEITNRHKDGSLLPEWLNITAVHDESAQITHFVCTFSDFRERKASAERIAFLSSHDSLTQLPNRTLFADRLDQALLTARRYQRGTALILLDIDRFRYINDSFGPNIGDELLSGIASRLLQQVREGDTVGRLSGDEFGFVMAHLGNESDAITLAQRILQAISHPFEIGGQNITMTACIGISIAPKDGDDSVQLLKCADIGLLRAKEAGRNTFRFYAPEMDANASRRLGLEAALRNALSNNELTVHYQPQISLDSGNLLGMEALLRWKTPLFGQVSPAEFIPIAEDSNLIFSIGEWVLREACRQTKLWLDLGLVNLHVAVNLSAKQFRQTDLLAIVHDALASSGLPARALELEITESAFIDDLDEAIALCKEIKATGVKISLDDFGTGYSSLAYISRFPFDKIKIDQAFVRDITENPVNAAIATAAIVMARSLNLTVLAEGVETEAQASFLRGRRCDAMQGYLFSRPLPAEEFALLLRDGKCMEIKECSTNHSLPTLLIVDDEPNILNSLRRIFRREGYQILTANSPTLGFEFLAQHPIQVVLCDQRMPEMSGTEFLGRVRQLYPDTVRLVLTGYTDLQSVTEAINKGAVFKFLTKPWDDDELREQVRAAFRIAKDLRQESFIPEASRHE